MHQLDASRVAHVAKSRQRALGGSGGLGCRHPREKAADRAQHLQERLQRLCAEVAFAVASQNQALRRGRVAYELFDQAGLPESWSACYGDALGRPGDCRAKVFAKQAHLPGPANEGCKPAHGPRLKPALCRRSPEHAVHRQRQRSPLEGHEMPFAGSEKMGFRPQRFFADVYLASLRHVRQPCGSIRHLAQYFEAAALKIAVNEKNQSAVNTRVQGKRPG